MRLFFAVTFALTTMLTINQSNAFDEQSVLKKFQIYAQENDIIFTFGSVEKTSNSDLIIKNADYYDKKLDQRQQIETLTLSNVRESNGGNLQYDSIEILNFEQKGKSQGNMVSVLIERAYSDGLKFSETANGKDMLLPSYTARGEVTNMTILTDDNRGKAKIVFPSVIAEGVEQTSLRNFKSELVKLSAGTGTVTTNKDEISFSLGAITVENMEQFGAQGFDIGFIDVGAFGMNFTSKTGEKVDFVFEGMTIKNFFSPDLSAEGSSLVSDKDLSAEIKPLSATLDGKQLMGWNRGYATSSNDKSTNTVSSQAAIEGMYFDFNNVPETPKNAKMLQTLQELNLLKMVLNVEGTGSWERESGLVDISKYNIQLEDGAAFQISARVSGYTEEVARQFTKALNAMNAESDEKKKNALAFQTMAYLAGLSIQRMEIVLDDQSLLDRVVNIQAKKLKQDPEQIKGIVGPMTTIMLTPYNIPELAAQTSQALGTFMQGGKKLTILAEPINGLAVTEIIALSSGVQAGSVTPADLAKRLNLTITAE